jgi:hypothetical protein
MAVSYPSICVTNVKKHKLTQNGSYILHHFNPRKSRVKITAVIHHGIFITLAPGHRTLASLDCKQVPFFKIINSKLKTRGQCYITFTAVIYERAM